VELNVIQTVVFDLSGIVIKSFDLDHALSKLCKNEAESDEKKIVSQLRL
jgi:hypothetical protein